MKKWFLLILFPLIAESSFAWGFYAHRRINYYAVFLLPPEMIGFYKSNISYLEEHAVDPDKRRYLVAAEGPRHYIDLDHYGVYPFDSLPRKFGAAVEKYSLDTLNAHGIAPWWLQIMMLRLTQAFIKKDAKAILKYSAELGHYIADSHVPLHTSSNHNGQHTDQRGIHGLWESRIPELLAEKDESANAGSTGWDFFISKAEYIPDTGPFFWERILESGAAADSVLKIEKQLSIIFSPDKRFAYENRNGVFTRQYSSAYTIAYDRAMRGMVERRMRRSILSVASCWYTCWVNAGQPQLK